MDSPTPKSISYYNNMGKDNKMGNLVEDSERMIKQLQDLMRATVEHNKALDARKYEVNIPALRALGMVD